MMEKLMQTNGILPQNPVFSRTVREWLIWGQEELAVLDAGESLSSAEWLLAESLGLERSRLYLEGDRFLSDQTLRTFQTWIALRKKRMPCAYITGKAFFWDEELSVGSGCLIPRPETELLVEQFCRYAALDASRTFSFLDLGTGSGAIGLALLRMYPKSSATLSDVSPDAMMIAQRNLERYDVKSRAELICADLFEHLEGRRWDAILCNPPYLAARDMTSLQPELRYEPRQALDGGTDGYEFNRQLAAQAPRHLSAMGCLGLEVGAGQAKTVIALLRKSGFIHIKSFQDYVGIERVILAQCGS